MDEDKNVGAGQSLCPTLCRRRTEPVPYTMSAQDRACTLHYVGAGQSLHPTLCRRRTEPVPYTMSAQDRACTLLSLVCRSQGADVLAQFQLVGFFLVGLKQTCIDPLNVNILRRELRQAGQNPSHKLILATHHHFA